ncbi:2OG-Fe(II) oxygenase [Roseofilum casamattae]|uniref:2OG-Fe(II) oxygenase n=1 Tax=Roseofilum casamattae BLCC-M143 TaxID=3022442 RepID=A0ABT7BZX3_9CYAN|nr:2OG-Fe(II) oxygenase [Roseofilum casamattae]MDJ1184357.1 2OG-Fe(II) oxygenase [Roseofilum casamattae BLCC-M143]
MIPTFVFEDMNEASVVWYHAIAEQMIQAQNNTVIHVNRYSKDRPQLSELYGFHPNDISIANFMIPAVYQDLVKQVYWLHPDADGKHNSQWICTHAIATDLPEEEEDASSTLTYRIVDKDRVTGKQLLRWKLKSQYKLAGLQHVTRDSDLALGSAVLDVVLDYFSSSDAGTSKEVYAKKIEEFVSFCRDRIQPQLICIRRSRLSGFMETEPWQWIEEYLCDKLDEVYGLKLIQLDTLWENLELSETFSENSKEVRKFTQFTATPASENRSDAAQEHRDRDNELTLPHGKINVYDDLIPEELFTEIYTHYQYGLRWQFQNIGDGDDVLPSFCANENYPDSIYELRDLVRSKLDPRTPEPRIFINGHVFGLGDGIHRDSYAINQPGNPAKTAVCYINPIWRADWDGETKFYDRRDPSQADLIYCCLPKPGRVIIFDNTIPHRGCPPSRLCNKLRITVAYQFPPLPEN